MKKILILVVMLGSWLCFSFAMGEEENGVLSDLGFEISADLSFYSQYVWRGILLDRDAVLQPGLSLISPESKLGRLMLGIWSSHDMQSRDNLASKEFDYTLDYTYDLEDISFSLGHIYYDFPDTDSFSREFYVGLTFAKLPLNPSVTYYRDYGRPEDGGGEGSYTEISGSYSLPIEGTSFTLDLSAHVGINHELFINGDGGDVGLSAGFTVPLTRQVSFSPTLNYSIPFGDLSNSDDGNQKSRFYAGGTISFAL